MLVLHALWSPGRGPLIWGLDGDRPVESPSQAVRSSRPHPFAADAAILAEVHAGKPVTATLLLPSLRMAPLDSPELTRATPRPAPQRSPALLPWVVPALLVDPAELAEESPQVRYGASVAHLRVLASFADDLAERGRFLPSLAFDAGQPVARWRPVVTGPDAVTMHGLVAATPPVARAEQDGPGGTAGQDPARLVADALDVLVDRAVREALGRSAAPLDLLPPCRGRRPRRLPAAEGWFAALTSADGRFPADQTVDENMIDELAEALAGWDAVGAGPTGPARALFRLTEPPPGPVDPGGPDDEAWRLEFLLQSTSDPSLQVGAEQVWSAPAGLQRWISRPQELLLGELGRASAAYPDLGTALRAPQPTGWDLDVDAAHHFLTTGAALLDAAGFGVQLPAWWDRKHRLGLIASGSSTAADAAVVAGGLHKEALADFRWSLAVGEDVLDEAEIAELVAAKAPLVRLRGRWIAVDPDRLRRGLEFLRRPRGTVTAADVLALAASHADDLDLPLPLIDVQVTGWVGDVLAGTAETTLRPVEPPASFAAQLRPYQRRGLAWLAFLARLDLGACLADDMGLGKTVQLLALEATDRAEGATPGPTLLLCPMSLVGNWQREAARFAPGLRVYAHHGPGRLHGEELAARLGEVDLVVSTYGTAVRDVEELAAHDWHRLALDEAQAIKNSQATASRTVRRLTAGHRIALTGTPMENRLTELWSVMDVLNPGLLGTTEKFRSRFAIPVERHGDDEAAQLLRRIIRPYLLRRVKTDPTIIDDLPEKIEIVQDYRLTPEQASLYQTVVDDMMEKIEGSEGIERRGRVLAAMAKLKQVCNHPAQLLHDGSPIGNRSGKVTRLEEILTEILAEGDKVLCFTQFTEFGEMLVPHLSARFDQEVLFLHGGVSRRRRDEMVARFQVADGPSVFLLSLKAGGTGLNLTAANHVVHLDRWWNPAVENQATDRAFRIGQRRAVQVRKFCCAGTLEERIDAMIAQASPGRFRRRGRRGLAHRAIHCGTAAAVRPRRGGDRRMSSRDDWYPPSRPRPIEGGLRARSRRGQIGQHWWSTRFIDGLESAGIGGRLARGKRYARAGQVIELRIEAGSAVALVQGSRPRPYRVRIGLTAFGKSEWAGVEQALADDAWYAAKLLAGEMPPDIDDVFAAAGLTLFPNGLRDLALDCSCPDFAVPCKHLAATLYLLAESFDDDPFAVLALRGRTREELLTNLSARRGGTPPGATQAEVPSAPPLSEALDSFYTAPRPPAPLPPARVAVDSLLDQVPPAGITVRGRDMVELLRPVYRALGEAAGAQSARVERDAPSS